MLIVHFRKRFCHCWVSQWG